MDYIIKKASSLSEEEQTALGFTGIPQDWPIEKYKYVDSIPEGFELINSEDLDTLIFNNQAAYDSWLQAKRPVITPPSPIIQITGEITPKTIKNEHCMQPWGCEKGRIVSNEHAATITLSQKSEDGYTFSYSTTLPMKIGAYVFQSDFCKRSWIKSIDSVNSTITFTEDRPQLDNGDGIYTTGLWIDAKIPEWKPIMELWGLTLSMKYSKPDVGFNDFGELSIVDLDDRFKNDIYTQALFGCDAVDATPYIEGLGFEDNGEYGHWTKYYDETWICNINGKFVKTTDGAPGEIPSFLHLRMSLFTSLIDDTVTCAFLDYYPTSPD